MKIKINKKNLLLAIIIIIIISVVVFIINNKVLKENIWGIKDAEIDTITIKMDDKDVSIKLYRDHYTNKTQEMNKVVTNDTKSINQYENAYVNIYVPEGTNIKDKVPVIYKLYNVGWVINTDNKIFENNQEYLSQDSVVNKAIKEGYIVVTAGLRSRGMVDEEGNYNHSSVPVADAKAVIRYLKYNDVGDSDKIIVVGESGGGGLALALGSNGNSFDFDEELEKIGALKNVSDDVFAVISYCGVTNLGFADYAYEYTYASTRQALVEDGFSNDNNLSEISLNISGSLAAAYSNYINSLGIKNENGEYLTAYFDKVSLTSSGTLYDGMKKLIIDSLQRGLDESDSVEEFYKTINNVSIEIDFKSKVPVYGNGTPDKEWNNSKSWITINNGKITDIDMNKYLYYVALINDLKIAPAFTSDGTIIEDLSENNLFGDIKDEYGYLNKFVWDLEKDGENGLLHSKYGSWNNYWITNKKLLQKQVRMVDSVSYLVDNKGKDKGDSAPYWWIRNGALDRDVSFANQALLYYALLNDKTIKDFDYEVAFNMKHSTNFEVEEVWNYIQSIVK